MLPLKTPPASICLLRLSALGDVTHVVPIVRTLQAHWPQTRLTWIIGSREAGLIGDLPDIEFVLFNKGAGLHVCRELRRRLRARRFDVLMNMQVSLRANIASLAVTAPIRLGFDRAQSKDLHGLFITHRIAPVSGQHVLDGFFGFLKALGLNEHALVWNIPMPADALTFAARHLPEGQRTLIISPCSSHALRNWRAERYAQVANHAVERWDMRVVLCGGPTALEREYAMAISQSMRQPPVDLIGKTTIKQLLALLRRADALVSPDSGPAHMATAVGLPVIGLYAATNPARAAPYFSREWCVDGYDAAARRYRGKPASALAWGTKLEYPGVMDLIEVDRVTERLDSLMLSGRTRQLPPHSANSRQ
jgi:heptosyltransferase I